MGLFHNSRNDVETSTYLGRECQARVTCYQMSTTFELLSAPYSQFQMLHIAITYSSSHIFDVSVMNSPSRLHWWQIRSVL